MRERFIQLTSGWIPISVLLLFAALVVIQERDDQPLGAGAIHASSEATVTVSLFDLNDRARLAAVRQIADSVMPLSEHIELAIDVSVYPVNDEFTTGAGRLE
ncbi:MAG: hypothetical protein ACR2QR_00955 [Woeseiaceae bacterium]